jgi:hypothetical protein
VSICVMADYPPCSTLMATWHIGYLEDLTYTLIRRTKRKICREVAAQSHGLRGVIEATGLQNTRER